MATILRSGGVTHTLVAARSWEEVMKESAVRRLIAALQTVLVGFGGAFVWSRTGRIEQFSRRQSVEDRMHRNFARVGARMEAAMVRIRDEQRKESEAK